MTDPTDALTDKTDKTDMTGGSPGAPIRILIAEDQALLRTTLAALLEAEPGMSASAWPRTAPARSPWLPSCAPTSSSWIFRCPASPASRPPPGSAPTRRSRHACP